MSYQRRITSHPDVLLGKPVIRGTRISVALILHKLAEGATPEDVLRMYPHVQPADVTATLQYAAEVLSNEVMIHPEA